MSVSIKGNELAAKRWAKALMELALENDGISKEDILDDLREVNENIENSRELYEVLNNPSISVEENWHFYRQLQKSLEKNLKNLKIL